MTRSPLMRFLLAGVLIVLIVVATFAYGNSQRTKQQQAKQAATQEQAKKDSEAQREQQKQDAQKQQADDANPKAEDSSKTTDTSAASPSASSDGGSASALPETEQIPATGSAAYLSGVLAAVTVPALVALDRKRKHFTS